MATGTGVAGAAGISAGLVPEIAASVVSPGSRSAARASAATERGVRDPADSEDGATRLDGRPCPMMASPTRVMQVTQIRARRGRCGKPLAMAELSMLWPSRSIVPED